MIGLACIPNAHPSYISWEQFQENLKILEANGRPYELAQHIAAARRGSGAAGRAVCGRCGRHFRVRYVTRRGKQEAWYVCDVVGIPLVAEPNCQSIAGKPIDKAIGATRDREHDARGRRAWLWRSDERSRLGTKRPISYAAGTQLSGLRSEADLAQRRFMLVDPNNRLVADTLEGEWNNRLRALAEGRERSESGCSAAGRSRSR